MDTSYLTSIQAIQTQLSDGSSMVVSLTWTLGPLKPDVLEIYYSFSPDDSLPGVPHVATISPDTKQPQVLNVSTIGKPVEFFLWLAPRLLDDKGTVEPLMPDGPDDSSNEVPFYIFAASTNFFIRYAAPPEPTAIATIASIQSNPKTLHSANEFFVTVTGAGGTINDFHLIVTENGAELKQIEQKSGAFQQTSIPKASYTFRAQASNQERGWGQFCAPTLLAATQNLYSVKAFLTVSGVSTKPPVLLKQFLTESQTLSMRSLLGI